MKKKLSLTSFQLKGGGWYKDGYSQKKRTITNAAKPDIAKKADATHAGSVST